MAAASGFSISVAGVKTIETLIFKTCSSSTDSLSQFRVFVNQLQLGGTVIIEELLKRGVSLNPRCDVVSAESLDLENKNDARASSVSALEQLKNSGIDRYSKEKSSIVVVGLSVHTAPVEIPDKLATLEAEWPRAIG